MLSDTKENFWNSRIWWFLATTWTFIYLLFVVVNFVLQNKYAFLAGSSSAIYIGILSIYVGSKEFDRWYENHKSRRKGELFILVFTIIVFSILLLSFVFGEKYKIPSEIVTTYIVILSIFAITQKSKQLHSEKSAKKNFEK